MGKNRPRQQRAQQPPPIRNEREAPGKNFKRRLRDVVEEMVLEAVATGLTIAIIAGAHYLLELLIGKGEKFFNLIPVAWVFDAGHIVVVGRLIWRTMRTYRD
ncbi:MAG: hypothetical protein ACLQU1_08495 [Bryobacteraceae bacterium]